MSQIGHSATCKACNSPHRVEIDRRLLAGESARSLERWSKDIGEPTSRSAFLNHQKEHLAVGAAIKERVAESQAVLDQAVDAGVDRLKKLERNIEVMCELRDLAAQHIKDGLAQGLTTNDKGDWVLPVCKSIVAMATRAATVVVQSIQALQKALGEVQDEEREFVIRWEEPDDAADAPQSSV